MAQIQAEPPPPTDPVEQELSRYFALLGTRLWDRRQRHNFATYVIGLMSELERKSLEPIACSFTQDPTEAERLHYRLQNLLADAPWPDEELRQLAADYAIAAMTRRAPILVWCGDDTSFPKSGNDSVGVQRQYCGELGKVANCQVAPSLTIGTKYAHVPIDMTLYLGKKWTDDEQLRKKAKIPPEVGFATKPQLLLWQIQQARRRGVPPGIVVVDAGFGNSSEFRLGVRQERLHYIGGVQLSTTVCIVHKGQIGPPLNIAQFREQLPAKAFRRYRWREGSRGWLSGLFAFAHVRVPDDPTGELLWLILEWRPKDKEPYRAYLSSLPPSTGRRQLVLRLKERYRPGHPGRLPSRGSHRSGRARLTHPAPRCRGLLRGIRGDDPRQRQRESLQQLKQVRPVYVCRVGAAAYFASCLLSELRRRDPAPRCCNSTLSPRCAWWSSSLSTSENSCRC